ncbi:MAG TPA: hypothetical protein VFA94_07630 [Acidimicrobiales bacterium]|nr:hypothetical protein [Acidimicrobiales bacterium]
MKRRTLDVMFSAGGLGIAALLLILGLVLSNRATFAKDYVHDQLVREDLTFPTADKLAPKEKEFTAARTGCVISNAGKAITSGKQAECYANEYLGGHLTWLATRLGLTSVAYVDGMNYRQLGVEQGNLKAKITAATASKDPALPALETQAADLATVRTKMFEGTMLRNALLTSYGFGSFGETGATTARIAYGAAALLLLLSLAGLVHAYLTPRTKGFAIPEPTAGGSAIKELVDA